MKNRSALQLLLVSLVIGLAACQISVPMYSDHEVFLVNLTYGTDHCQVLVALMENSYNLLNYTKIPDQCGSKYIGQDFYTETYYTSSLSMSGFEGVWNFTNAFQIMGYNRIALTSDQSNSQYHSNIIDSLYANGLIKSKRFFFNVKEFDEYPFYEKGLYEAGSFQIGQPNLSLLENGSKLVTMKSHLQQTQYVHILEAKQEIRHFGQTLKTQVDSFRFEVYNNEWSMDYELYNSLMLLWQENHVSYYQVTYSNNSTKTCFTSISDLSPIDIILTQEDGSDFVFTIPHWYYVYEDKIQKNYCFIFNPSDSPEIIVGQSMLLKYYYGYDTATQQTFLGKKSSTSSVSTEKVYNFRGSLQL